MVTSDRKNIQPQFFSEKEAFHSAPAVIKKWWMLTSFHFALIIILVGVIYSRIFSAPFVYDDIECILFNPAINDFQFLTDRSYLKSLSLSEDIYKNIVLRPVTYLSFAVNYRMHGYDVVGYHTVNIFVHCANALLVYLITRFTLDTRRTSDYSHDNSETAKTLHLIPLFAALLFASHPVQTQSVTYITQRFASLVTLLYLSSLALYITSSTSKHFLKSALYYSGSLIAACTAMKTKETAFTLPLILALYEIIFFRNNLKRCISKLAPFMLTLLIIPLTVMKLKAEFSEAARASVSQSMNLVNYAGISQLDYLFSQLNVIVTYIRLLFLPINQHLIHDVTIVTSLFQPTVMLSLTMILSLLALAAFLLYRSKSTKEPYNATIKLAAFGIIWFFTTNSVESSLIPLDELLVEQRMYLPSIGFVWAVIPSMALQFGKWNQLGARRFFIVATLIILLMAITTYARNELWRDPIELWKDTIQKSPKIARSYLNLGSHYFEKGKHGEALDVLNASLRIDPQKIEIYVNIAKIYRALNQNDKAASEYLKAIKIQPRAAYLYENLGETYLLQGKYDIALPVFEHLVRINPYSPVAHSKLGKIYETLGMHNQAISEYQCAQRLSADKTIGIEQRGRRDR